MRLKSIITVTLTIIMSLGINAYAYGEGPSVQVVNNTSNTFVDAKVGKTSFPPPSRFDYYCTGGCSSAFYHVAVGKNTVTIDGTSYGFLRPFKKNKKYAVNIRDNGCAELWIRKNTTPIFNEDTTKRFVSNNGRCP